MGGIAVKKGNASTSYTGTKYQFDAGVKHLYIRTSTGANDVISYPLTTETSASQYCSLAFKVGNSTCYLASRASGDQATAGYFNNNITTASQQLSVQVGITQGMNPNGNYAYTSTTFSTYYTRYSITNQNGSTYTASIPYNNYGVTKSNTATQTYGQSTIELITSTKADVATSYNTDAGIAGMTVSSSATDNINVGTYSSYYNTTRSSGYNSSIKNGVLNGTLTSVSTKESVYSSSSYQLSRSGFTRNASYCLTGFNSTGCYCYESAEPYYATALGVTLHHITSGGGNFNIITENTLYTYMTQNAFCRFDPGDPANDMTSSWTSTDGNFYDNETFATYYNGEYGTSTTATFRYNTYTRSTVLSKSIYNVTTYDYTMTKPGVSTYTTSCIGNPGGEATVFDQEYVETVTGYNALTTGSQFKGDANPPASWADTSLIATGVSNMGSRTLNHATNSAEGVTKKSTTVKTDAYWFDRWGRTGQYSTLGWNFNEHIPASVTSKNKANGTTSWSAADTYTKSKGVSTWQTIYSQSWHETKISYIFTRSSKTAGTKSMSMYVTLSQSRTAWSHYSQTTESILRSIRGVTGYEELVEGSQHYSYSTTRTCVSNVATKSYRKDLSFRLLTYESIISASREAWNFTYHTDYSRSYSMSKASNYETSQPANSYTTQSRYTLTSSSRSINKETKTYKGTITNYSFTRTTSSHNANI